MASIEEKDPLRLIDVEERQVLKDFEDQTIDIILVLDSIFDTISSLAETYKQFLLDSSAREESVGNGDFDPVAFRLQEKLREVMSSRKKVENLHTKVQSTTNLVSNPASLARSVILNKPSIKLSSLLDLGNGLSLKQLAEEARKENIVMRKLTEKGTKDAAAVKVLTIITLIYLPATVVSVSILKKKSRFIAYDTIEFLLYSICQPGAIG